MPPATATRALALDGKTLRRSHDRAKGKAALHLVSAWADESGLVLGQVAVASKANEIVAIPHLLALLDVRGVVGVEPAPRLLQLFVDLFELFVHSKQVALGLAVGGAGVGEIFLYLLKIRHLL